MTSPERAHGEAGNGTDPAGRPKRAGAQPRAALAVAGLLLLLGILLVALPRWKVARFEQWRGEQLERGVQVDATPAELELAWVRLGLTVVGGLCALGAFGVLVALARRLAAIRESANAKASDEQPLLGAALESIRASLDQVQGDVARTREELAEVRETPAPEQAAPAAPIRPCPVSTPLTTLVEEAQSPWAPQRLAALHSLRRLAGWDPEWAPVVVQILCAYLQQHAAAAGPDEEAPRRTLLGGSRLREPVAEAPTNRCGLTLQTALDVLGALPKEHLEHPLDLRGLDLRDLCLKGARLQGAMLEGTMLSGVSLAGSRLEGADLSGSRGLTAEQLAEAHTDENTRLPAALEQGG